MMLSKHSLLDFSDRICIITGSSRGIGRVLAEQILGYGGSVLVNGRTESRLAETAQYLRTKFGGEKVASFCGDVSQAEQAEELIATCLQHFGRLDVLINNAGLAGYGNISESGPEAFHKIIDVNIYGSLLPTKYALPHLKSRQGQILFISSLAGIHGLPTHIPYSLSKMALTALLDGLRIEEQQSGIYFGIAYVGFTENEQQKIQIGPDGDSESMPQRKNVAITTREVTAYRILKQIVQRRRSVVHSPLGMLLSVVNRLSPGLVEFILKRSPLARQK